MLTPSFTPARIRLWGSTATGNVRHWLHTPEVLARQLKRRVSSISVHRTKNKTATRTSRGDQFAEGWVLAVISEIQSFALTDDERELMQQWLEHKYPQTQTTGRVNREEAAMATPRAMRGFVKGRTSDCTARSVGRNNRNWRPDDYAIR